MCTLPNSNSASLLSPAVGPVLITDGPNSRQHVESLQAAGAPCEAEPLNRRAQHVGDDILI
jgi:hypothetical protein